MKRVARFVRATFGASASFATLAVFLGACGGPRSETASPDVADAGPAPSAAEVGDGTVPADESAAQPTNLADATEPALAPGALVEVWAVDGPLERGYEPLNFEPPSWSLVWLSSGRSPEPLGGTAWVARVRGKLRVDEAGSRELQLTLSGGARFVLDGALKLDQLESNARGARSLALGELAEGEHPFELWTWGNADGTELALAWRGDAAQSWRFLARNDWAHERVLPRTEPGVKRLKRPLARPDGWSATPNVAPALQVDSLPLTELSAEVGGLATAGPNRWLVLERGARASVRLFERAANGPSAPRTFASGLDQPGGIASSDGRVFVVQRNELTELVDRDGDGVADEYRVALEFPGREFARPCGLALDQGLACALFETDAGVNALVASLADGRTTLHDLRGARRGFVAPGFGGAFLVICDDGSSAPVRAAWIGLVAERAWSVELAGPDTFAGFQGLTEARAVARVSGDGANARFFLGATQVSVGSAPDGFDVSLVAPWGVGLGPPTAAAAATLDGGATFLASSADSLTLVRPTSDVAALLGARSFANGVELEFSAPLALDSGWERENWFVDGANGSGPFWVSVSTDRRRVALGLEAGPPFRAFATTAILDERGHSLWPRVWTTRVRTAVGGAAAELERAAPSSGVRNTLSDEERATGWRLLFDGASSAGWRNFGKDGAATGWAAENGELVRVGDGGDLVTDELFDSFELEFDWRLWPGGNGGVFFHVVDGYDTVWRTGPEFQLLDNAGHADGQNPLTSAGSNYALHAPEFDDTHPITTWNHARLVVDGAHVEHWLNGVKQCEYELWTDAWKARVLGSKFAAMPDYGLAKTGRIALQDHGDRVAFKNVKLRPIVR